jgi:hypothetical protein
MTAVDGSYSAFAPENFTTLPHIVVSCSTKRPKSAGAPPIGVALRAAKRACSSRKARLAHQRSHSHNFVLVDEMSRALSAYLKHSRRVRERSHIKTRKVHKRPRMHELSVGRLWAFIQLKNIYN